MPIDLGQFREGVFEEILDHVTTLESLMLRIDPAAPTADDLASAFRAIHSIKGTSGTFGFGDIAKVAHELETLLDKARAYEISLSANLVNMALRTGDFIRGMVHSLRELTDVDQLEVDRLLEGLRSFETQGAPPDGNVPVNSMLETVSDKTSSEASSIRVSSHKVDSLINLVGEMVIAQSILERSAQEIELASHEDLRNAIAELSRQTRDLREGVMSIRMLPIGVLFQRFPRLVREVSGQLRKQITIKMFGEDTELDKGLIERITDPLMHLIRNSIDHGIEEAESRRLSGKPAEGTISLRAWQQGGSVFISIADDGRGLDREKILARARLQNLCESDDLSDEQVWNLIYLPGFTTANKVSDLSGRGVGMDVVKRNIEEVGGKIFLETAPGVGTTFTIRMPLTVAIIDGLSVTTGGQLFIIPLSSVIESVQFSSEHILKAGADQRMMLFRGAPIPLIDLASVIELDDRNQAPSDGICVIVESDSAKFALRVDTVENQHQVVMKSIEANYRRVRGYSGATIMADGTVALILDVKELTR